MSVFAKIFYQGETLYGSPLLKKEEAVVLIQPVVENIKKPEILIVDKIVESVKTEIESPKIYDLVAIVDKLDSESQEFLAKVLSSIGRNINEIEIIELAQLSVINIREIIEKTNALFSFGIPYTKLGFKSDLSPYVLKMAKEKHYLFADPLSVIMLNVNNEKRLLWSALKNILN